MRTPFVSVGVFIALLVPVAMGEAGTCDYAYVVEGQRPAVFNGPYSSTPGFVIRYWAWGANTSDQGNASAQVKDDDSDVALNPGIIWANSTNCSDEIEGTGILVEVPMASIGGRFALLAVDGAEINVDALQAGGTQCLSQPIPTPRVTSFGLGSDDSGDYADVTLGWDSPSSAAWAVSTISPVLAGYGVYYRTGSPVDSGYKAHFARVGAVASETEPYVLNDEDSDDGLLPAEQTSCTVRIRPGQDYFFALSLIFDGSGTTSGNPQAHASAVETVYVSACSDAVAAENEVFFDGFDSGDTSLWSAEWTEGLVVTATAARSGTHGLEVTVGSSCTSPEYLVLSNQTVSGTSSFEACYSIAAGDNFVVASGGDATFTAGYSIGFEDGFSVESGGAFTAALDAPLNPFTFVQDDSPTAETSYSAELFINLDNVTLGAAAELENFIAYSNGEIPELRLLIRSGPVLALEVRDDSGTFHSTANVATVAGWNKVVFSWEASASATASLTVNDGTPQSLTGLDTDSRRIDFVRWGSVGGTVDGSAGTIYQDDFSSWR